MLSPKTSSPSPAYKRWEWFLRYGQWFGHGMMAMAMVFSNFFMSFFGFWMLGAVVLEMITDHYTGQHISDRWQRLRANIPARFMVGLYLLLAVGMLWTEDLEYGVKDLRMKLPILFIPVLMPLLRPIPEKVFRFILLSFVVALTIAVTRCLAIYVSWNNPELHDVREISVFISHIRFSLMIVFGMAILVFVFMKDNALRWPAVLLLVYFLFFLWILESVTGFSILILMTAVWMLRAAVLSKVIAVRIAAVVLAIGLPLGAVMYFASCYHHYFSVQQLDWEHLETHTPGGEAYEHHPENRVIENGHYVYQYIAWNEMYAGWSSRSKLHPDSLDGKGHVLKGTLIRYLTSKGLRKDAGGLAALTDEDIRNIEMGITSIADLGKTGLRARIDKILFEYDVYINGGNPTGHSVFQRLEFWKAARAVISEHPVMGVGTGDVRKAVFHQYELNKSKLANENRLNAHNQYLTLWAATGIVGLLLFIAVLLIPLRLQPVRQKALLLSFMVIVALSCVAEDTLETQAGVTFFAFWYVLLTLPSGLSAKSPRLRD
jgi:O-Antigen ligase